MAFPPNYNQQRQDRKRSKDRKTLEKQWRRDEKSQQRKEARAAEERRGEAAPPDREKN